MVAPFVEFAPFEVEPPMRFVVHRTGSCLNVRKSPGLASQVVACLADGSVVNLDLEGQPLWDGATQGYGYALDDGTWVLVNAVGGVRGWVSAAYLGWAVPG